MSVTLPPAQNISCLGLQIKCRFSLNVRIKQVDTKGTCQTLHALHLRFKHSAALAQDLSQGQSPVADTAFFYSNLIGEIPLLL